MYAQLCKRLSDSVSQFDGEGSKTTSGGGVGGGPQTFLDVLSKVCWEKFENRFKYYQVGGQGPVNGQEVVLTADEEERQHVVKQKMLGNLKFIGELYLLGQLDDPIIHNSILQLLGNDKVSTDLQVRCQDLECLCQLIRTCGKSLDAGPGGNLMDQYFHKMTKDSLKHQVYPPRIRFMLRDVIDLRADKWMPRTALSQQPGPMPIHLLRGSTKEDDDREAASTEHHHRMLSRGGGGGGGDRDAFGSPSRGGRDDRGTLYGGRGSGGRDPMRGGDPMLSSTDLFMSKIPGFNDMFNNLSLGTSSTSSLLPPPPLMHNNRFLNKDGGGGERDYRGNRDANGGGGGGGGGYDRQRNNNNRDDYYHNNNQNKGGYRQNNNNGGEGRSNYGGRDGGNQYGGRGSGGNYRDQQQNSSSSSDRHNNGSPFQRRDAHDDNDPRAAPRDQQQESNGYAGRNSRDGAGRDGQRDNNRDEGRNYNNYNNNRSTSPYNNSRENGQNNREYNQNRGGDRDGGGYVNGGGGGGGYQNNQQQQNNFNRNRNNQNQGGNYNQNAGQGAGGNYQNNRYNNNKGPQPNGAGAGGVQPINGQQKDLAPRFKRTMMGAGGPGGVGGQRDNNYHQGGGGGQGGERERSINNNMSSSTSSASSGADNSNTAAGVENLQMRPAANSLLFKANTMNVNKLPLSQPQQRVIPTNSMMQQQQQQGQEKEKAVMNGKENAGSPFKSSPLIGSGGGGGGKKDFGRKEEQLKTPEVSNKDKDQQTPQSAASSVEAGKKKKKDKGPTKEEVLKKFTTFLEETYFQRTITEEVEVKEEEVVVVLVVEAAKEEEKNAADQLESENEEKKKDEDASVESPEEEKKEVTPTAEVKAESKKEEVVEEKTVQEEKEEQKVVKAPKVQQVEREQTLEEIVKLYVELKVPDKFVKDCLATLYSVSIEREIKEQEDAPKSLTESLVQVDAANWWTFSPVERCIVFVDALKQHQKLGNNVAESVKQTVQIVATETAKQLPWVSKMLATAVLCNVYSLAELAALTDNGKYYPLMLDTLQKLNVKQEDAERKKKLTELFAATKVDLLQVLPEADRNKEQLVAVLDERGLDFLCPLLKVQSQMWKQIKTDANPQLFYKWIKENVDAAYFVEEGFIQALVTVLLKQITQETTLSEGADQTKNPDKALIEKEKQALQKYSAVLNAFLSNAQLQLNAIYALQVYCHSVDFPKGMLLRWFTALYDLNVVEEEAFLQWKEDLTDVYPGKQRALFQVNAWLMWLQEAESEEEEDN